MGPEVGRRDIYLSLTGGLGNQLFQWAAAEAISSKLQLELKVLDIETGDRGFQLDYFGITRLKRDLIPHDIRDLAWRRPKKETFAQRLAWATTRQSVARRLVEESVSGFDPEVARRARSGALLKGFFQSPEYFADISGFIRKRLLDNARPSARAATLLDRLANEKWIGIHVRQGDYLKFPNVFSPVTRQYFSRALERLGLQHSDLRIVVFSDDVERAKILVPFANDYVGNDLAHGGDVIIALSQASAVIGSNSTLSWWAAFLAQPNCTVVFPTPWFTDDPMRTKGLLFPAWKQVPV